MLDNGAYSSYHGQFKMPGSFIMLLIITSAALFLRPNFYCFIRHVSCNRTDIILISSWFQCYSWETISLTRYARCMQTYVLFQYSILRDIVSKTSESLIRRIVNLAFRFAYISYRVAVYTQCVIYAYNIIALSIPLTIFPQ